MPGHYQRECRKFRADRRSYSERPEAARSYSERPETARPYSERPEAARSYSERPETAKGYRTDAGDDDHYDAKRHQAAAVSEPEAHERAWMALYEKRKVASEYEALQTRPWYLDSAATSHMTNCKDCFIKIKQIRDTVTVADGGRLPIKGIGMVRVQFGRDWVRLDSVLYVPDLQENLLSIGQLADRGIDTRFSSYGAELKRHGEILAVARKIGRNYVLQPTEAARMATTERNADSYKLWHKRMAHPGEEKMRLLLEVCDEIPRWEQKPEGVCDTCARTKSVRDINRGTPERATKRLMRVHIDIWGPYPIPTPSGARYILSITDDFSRKSWIYLLQDRTDIYDLFPEWQKAAERETDEKLKAIRIDNARENLSLGENLRKTFGIAIEPTTAYTHEQVGVAERYNRTLVTRIRAMLLGAGLPRILWGEAAHTACYLGNRIPKKYDDQLSTPEERWSNQKPSLDHIRIFGCVAYAHLTKEQRRDKIDPTSIRGILVGYTPTSRQYRIYNPENRTVKRYSTIRFDETRMGGTLFYPRRDPIPFEIDLPTNKPQEEIGDTIVVQTETPQPPESSGSQTQTPETEPTGGQTRSGRQIQLPARYQVNKVTADSDQEVTIPTTYEEAISGPQKEQWEAAIASELQSITFNDVWDLVDRPRDTNIVSNKWVFDLKRLPTGQIKRYKARLVARGFSQQYGIDYEETFAPVVRLESLRTLLAIAAIEDLEVHQMDVSTAYLAGKLQEIIYMEAPLGIAGASNKVCRLKKGLYGLKQSGRVWNQRIVTELKDAGMTATDSEPSVWYTKDYDLILALYVDDIFLFGRGTQQINWIKGFLTERFDIKDLGPASMALGIRIRRDRAQRKLWIDQSHYVRQMLKGYGECKGVATPIDGYESIRPTTEQDQAFANTRAYQHTVGEMNWLVRGTRLDLAFSTHGYSQFCQQPMERHWTGTRRIQKYLRYSESLSICYGGQPNALTLYGYSDSDFASDTSDRRSTMGYAFMLNGGAITWATQKQRSVSTSTTEAEYVGLCNAAKEAVWIRNFLQQIGRSQYIGEGQPTRIYGDNQGALSLVRNPELHARTKHIDVQYHYVRELKERGVITEEYIPTSEMAADCLTKPLKKDPFWKNLKLLGMVME